MFFILVIVTTSMSITRLIGSDDGDSDGSGGSNDSNSSDGGDRVVVVLPLSGERENLIE